LVSDIRIIIRILTYDNTYFYENKKTPEKFGRKCIDEYMNTLMVVCERDIGKTIS